MRHTKRRRVMSPAQPGEQPSTYPHWQRDRVLRNRANEDIADIEDVEREGRLWTDALAAQLDDVRPSEQDVLSPTPKCKQASSRLRAALSLKTGATKAKATGVREVVIAMGESTTQASSTEAAGSSSKFKVSLSPSTSMISAFDQPAPRLCARWVS